MFRILAQKDRVKVPKTVQVASLCHSLGSKPPTFCCKLRRFCWNWMPCHRHLRALWWVVPSWAWPCY
ncbi:hypothetical protein GPALN_006625 [Globodera pallida]|nr:hypothetical protein GPALN_006625 [Globodera pallida]